MDVYNLILGFIIFFCVIAVGYYLHIKNTKKFIPSEVIIGKRTYYDKVNRVFINVVDFDGNNVYFILEQESEITHPLELNKDEFLRLYSKVPKKFQSETSFILR